MVKAYLLANTNGTTPRAVQTDFIVRIGKHASHLPSFAIPTGPRSLPNLPPLWMHIGHVYLIFVHGGGVRKDAVRI
jgi:hypothetical protein